MKKTEIAKILEWHNSGTLKTDEAVERICSLFSVVGQSEQLVCPNCNSPHITDRIFKKECLMCGQKFKAN